MILDNPSETWSDLEECVQPVMDHLWTRIITIILGTERRYGVYSYRSLIVMEFQCLMQSSIFKYRRAGYIGGNIVWRIGRKRK